MEHEFQAADDTILPFQVADTAVRGRVVRLSGSIHEILSAHSFPPLVSELVGEATCLVALMGASLKFDGKLIFQAQGNGPVSMVVANYAAGGDVRAMAKIQEAGAIPASGSAGALIGDGHLMMTIDQGADMERYQGVTPLTGDTLADMAVGYFDQSEQIPTVVKLSVGKFQIAGGEPQWRAGGIIAQFVPSEGGERERGASALMSEFDRDVWERAAAFVETTQPDELLDPDVSPQTLLYRLFHEDGVRVFDPQPVRAACACNMEKIAAVLARYSSEDLADMVDDGAIRVSCEFCRTEYLFAPDGTPKEHHEEKEI